MLKSFAIPTSAECGETDGNEGQKQSDWKVEAGRKTSNIQHSTPNIQ
jgi:hypothetical protein